MRLRRAALLFVALFVVSALMPARAERRLTDAENDSVVQALATIWGEYLHNKADKSSNSKFNEEYMRGLTEALGMAQEETPYYTGLQDGIVIDSRLTQIEQMGGFSIDRRRLAKAFERAAKGRSNGFTPATADRYMNYILTAVTADAAVKERSEAFLDSIESKPGVHREMSGLLWEKLTDPDPSVPGAGKKLDYGAIENVKINYVGRLYDGTVFDEHYAERPVVYRIRDLIPGFSESLYIVPVGATYRFYLPPRLAYGEAGINGVIPPNAALVFDVTLLEIEPKADGESSK